MLDRAPAQTEALLHVMAGIAYGLYLDHFLHLEDDRLPEVLRLGCRRRIGRRRGSRVCATAPRPAGTMGPEEVGELGLRERRRHVIGGRDECGRADDVAITLGLDLEPGRGGSRSVGRSCREGSRASTGPSRAHCRGRSAWLVPRSASRLGLGPELGLTLLLDRLEHFLDLALRRQQPGVFGLGRFLALPGLGLELASRDWLAMSVWSWSCGIGTSAG